MEDDDLVIFSSTLPDSSMLADTSSYPWSISALSTTQISSITVSNTTSNTLYTSSGPVNMGFGSIPSFNVGSSSIFNNTTTINSDLNVDGDIVWKGKSLGKLLEKIESRLAILEPKPEKLEKYAALEKAYAHYKLLETLINEEE